MKRQPPLFDFRPTEQLRHSGFTPEEERELLIFCLAEDYPRTHVVGRTGTTYVLRGEIGAATLYKRLRNDYSQIFSPDTVQSVQKQQRRLYR